jgi:hypothetical protein
LRSFQLAKSIELPIKWMMHVRTAVSGNTVLIASGPSDRPLRRSGCPAVAHLDARHIRWAYQSADHRLSTPQQQLRTACRDAALCTQVLMLSDIDALAGNEERDQVDLFDSTIQSLLHAVTYVVILNGPTRRNRLAARSFGMGARDRKRSGEGAREARVRHGPPAARDRRYRYGEPSLARHLAKAMTLATACDMNAIGWRATIFDRAMPPY